MRIKHLDLIIILVIVALNVAWTQIPHLFRVVGIILALPLILLIPGYALTQMLFRKRSLEQIEESRGRLILRPSLKLEHPIGPADQILLSLGLSMAIDVMVGFGLNILPIGLQAFSWVLSLSLITTIFVVLTFLLRRQDIPGGAKLLRTYITLRDGLLFGLAILATISALWLAIAKPFQPQFRFTQIWIVPANQTSKSCEVSIGAQSFEANTVTYRVVMIVNKTQTNAWSAITLSPQEKWSQSVPVTPGTASNLLIEVQLYRRDKPTTLYRDVHLTLFISKADSHGLVQAQ